MHTILETTDPVLVSYVEALLKEARIALHVADVNMSIVEGSLGILPRRILVHGEDAEAARRVLAGAGLSDWLAGGRRGQVPAMQIAPVGSDEHDDDLGLSEDAFLGGRLGILQFERGYRAGLDAVLLAAAAPVREGRTETVLDAGAGAGVVGLCVARRIADARVTLVEIESELAALARRNIERNALLSRVAVVEADVGEGGAALDTSRGLGSDLESASFAHVLANPPYLETGRGTRPPDRLKSRAHQMAGDGPDRWIRFLAAAAAADGTATIIHRADALAALLDAFEGRFGAIKVFPIFPRERTAATRVIVQGIKGSRAPMTLLPGLVLHGDGNAFRPEVEAILRQGAGLDLEP